MERKAWPFPPTAPEVGGIWSSEKEVLDSAPERDREVVVAYHEGVEWSEYREQDPPSPKTENCPFWGQRRRPSHLGLKLLPTGPEGGSWLVPGSPHPAMRRGGGHPEGSRNQEGMGGPRCGAHPRAASKLLMSFLIFQISTFLSAALGSSAIFSPPPL